MTLKKGGKGVKPVPGQIQSGHQECTYTDKSQYPFAFRNATFQRRWLHENMHIKDCTDQYACCSQVNISENETDCPVKR